MLDGNPILNKTIRKNLRLYKLIRKLYFNIKFRGAKEEYKKRRKKYVEKIGTKLISDLSHKPDINVILISVDCLRFERTSLSPHSDRDTTPFLKGISGYSSPMIVSSSWTYPSIASLSTGFYPHNHKAVFYGHPQRFTPSKLRPMLPNILTIGEILNLFGYSTYFSTSVVLAYLALKGRFETSKLDTNFADAEIMISDLKDWITKQKGPFFAHIHLKDPHEPLKPPSEFYNYFGTVKKLPNIEYWGRFQKPENQNGKEFEEFKENKILLYDNTLRYVDYILEQFYAFLEEHGLVDNTILIITADHGEEFWDHAELEAKYFYDVRGYAGIGHGHSVFNELIQVPLIMTGPGVPKKEEKDKFVSGVDLVPTLLDLLGIQHSILFDGMNMFKAPKKRLILSENTIHGYEKKALIYGKLKLIYSKDDGIAWIFNLKNDPKEQNPIIDDELSKIFLEKLKQIQKEKIIIQRGGF